MKNTKYVAPLVPEKCPICGADWKGGHEVPGNRMKNGLVVAFSCGGSMSAKKSRRHNAFKIIMKNCWCEDNINAENDVDKIAIPQNFNPFDLNQPFEFENYYIMVNKSDDMIFGIKLDNE